jgi:hypothetical protein
MTGSDRGAAADEPERRRVRVKRRVAPVLSRTRMRYLTALILAVVAALAVAAFVAASLDGAQGYMPSEAVH